jgi:hypothetical protein
MHNWGVMLAKGMGVEKDEAAGRAFVEKAALAAAQTQAAAVEATAPSLVPA